MDLQREKDERMRYAEVRRESGAGSGGQQQTERQGQKLKNRPLVLLPAPVEDIGKPFTFDFGFNGLRSNPSRP